ncbi:MAG TPA: hypothetical protein VHN14_08270, partial [Kofleriaceae bacterium]|nr:hypothetical protein [Kofleriaceae bacterium]
RERRPEIPEGLERIILEAMAQSPGDRPANAVVFEQALLAFCGPAFRDHASGRLSSPRLPLPTPLPSSARRTGNGLDRDAVASDHTVLAGSHPTGQTLVAVTGPDPPSAIVPPRRARARWITGAIALVAGIVAAVVVAGGGDPPVTAAPPTSPATLPVAHAVAGTAPGPPPEAMPPPVPPGTGELTAPAGPPPVIPAAPAATITLRFAVDPPGAALLLDGARIKTTELVVPKDGAPHTLRITAPGYLGREETVRFDESQRLVVQLKRTPRPVHGNDRHKRDPDADRMIDSESPYK